MKPSMGTGVFVIKKDVGPIKFLIGKRSDTCEKGPGVWALPGGTLEPNETITECAIREVLEETGLVVTAEITNEFQNAIVGVSDHRPREDWLTFWVAVKYCEGTPRVIEPHKCVEWLWVSEVEFNKLVVQEGEQIYWINRDVLHLIMNKLYANITQYQTK